MKACRSDYTFENWAQTLKFKAERFCEPENEADVIQLVNGTPAGTCIRTQGGRHSWSQLVLTRDTLVGSDKLKGPITVDPANKQATVPAGIRIADLTKELSKHKLGLTNLGSIQNQSIAGATATGTHGTGLGIGNLSTQIVRLKVVTGTGDPQPLTIDGGELLDAARVSLGALGIITEVTLQCVDDYNLEFDASWRRFDDVVDQIDTLNKNNDRVRLWWLVSPILPKDSVIVTTMNRTATSLQSNLSPLEMETNTLLSILFHGLINPSAGVELLKFTAHYTKVLTLPRLPIFHRECEYAVPVEKTGEALRLFKRVVEEGDFATTLPIEVRFAAGDNSLLSPSHGRENGVCYIGVNTQARNTEPSANELYARFEPMMKGLGGRPHWGKHFTLNRQEVRQMYPDTYDTFNRLRNDLDPKGIFANSLIHDLFD